MSRPARKPQESEKRSRDGRNGSPPKAPGNASPIAPHGPVMLSGSGVEIGRNATTPDAAPFPDFEVV